jgi:hypothetical protein
MVGRLLFASLSTSSSVGPKPPILRRLAPATLIRASPDKSATSPAKLSNEAGSSPTQIYHSTLFDTFQNHTQLGTVFLFGTMIDDHLEWDARIML